MQGYVKQMDYGQETPFYVVCYKVCEVLTHIPGCIHAFSHGNKYMKL